MALPEELLPTLRGALERMIPADDDPGALDLDCDRFILELATEQEGLEEFYASGLLSLQKEGFDRLDDDGKDRLLTKLERCAERHGWTVCPSAFVETLAQHAMEGFYTHPQGWQTVGFEVTL